MIALVPRFPGERMLAEHHAVDSLNVGTIGQSCAGSLVRIPMRLNMARRTEFAALILTAFLLPALATRASAYEAPAASTRGAANSTAIGKQGPLAGTLLPCPMSVPCRAEPANQLPPTPSLNVADTSNAVRSSVLLACPYSVPCIAPGQSSGFLSREVRRKNSRGGRTPVHLRQTTAVTRPRREISSRKRATDQIAGKQPARSSQPAALKNREARIALGNDQVNRRKAEQILQQVSRALRRIDRTRLSYAETFRFKEAYDFSSESRRALGQQDNLVALTLAEKARQLCPLIPPPGK